jgi:alkanesulfonate monooxygenase SsuD/methylene tetrahydromethanopterin reductase-like flavin-dependent oxidoreductase (luciferase family)
MEQTFNSPEGRWWSPLIRACLYVVMFERNPLHSVDRVTQMIRNGSLLAGTPEEYAQAIREALSSDAVLSLLVGEQTPDSETICRSYLAELERRLEAED